MIYDASISDCIANFFTVPIISDKMLNIYLYRFTDLSLIRPFTIITGTLCLRAAFKKFGHNSVSTGKNTRGFIFFIIRSGSHGKSIGK